MEEDEAKEFLAMEVDDIIMLFRPYTRYEKKSNGLKWARWVKYSQTATYGHTPGYMCSCM